ncbi:UDP-glycosyltransferase 74F2 [Vitis vinifera]|uniref:UDP-glycosyltransferase 74F2 n=1 Tax=Vitis vinifera TaxID=29760 RepID=A0A438GRB8_VITVI|nr:UDP-glycosyltransferase 74F2 [Vitis vinifera]
MERGKRVSETHVMVFPSPVQSHINPMLQFSKRLISKGLKVTLVATTSIDAKSMPTSINIELIPDGLDRKEKKSVDASMQLFETVVSQSLPELIEKHSKSDHPANVLVYDASMPWAHGIAERLGLVGAAFFTQSCAVTAIYHYVSQGVEIPVKGPTLPMPFMPPLGIDDLPSFVKDPGSYPAVWSLISKQVSTFQKVKWALFNSFDKLEDEFPIELAGIKLASQLGGIKLAQLAGF